MNLKELKKLIAEEYAYYKQDSIKEQPAPPAMPMDGPMDDPMIAVSDNDIDAEMGEENPMDTLKQIFDMLKDFFEEGDKPAAPKPPKKDDKDDDKKDDDKKDDDKKDDDKKDDKGSEALQERFQKLANIIK